MTMPISGFSNLTPSYTKETEQEQMKKGSSTPSSGAILTKDSLEVPFEKQISAHSQEADSGRPSLPPLFRMRFINDHKGEDLSRSYYQALRDELPPLLKEKLSNDEVYRDLADRNPDLVALDASLKFEANWLALTALATVSSNDPVEKLVESQPNLELPIGMQQELIKYGSSVLGLIDHYLDSKGRDDLSYEILFNISNQMKEALDLLKSNHEKDTAE